MSVVVIKYSTPLQNKGELLDGNLYNNLMGWKDVAVVIQTHVLKSNLQHALNTYGVPTGYYLTAIPQISPDPPKLRMYTIVTTCERFSRSGSAFEIERPSLEPAYTGI